MKIIKQDQLPGREAARDLIGAEHNLPITFIFVDGEPGRGPALHRHPYTEVFVVVDGEATFTVGDHQQSASGGDVVVAEAREPHRFVNSGSGRLRQIAIHLSPTFSTEWLDETAAPPA